MRSYRDCGDDHPLGTDELCGKGTEPHTRKKGVEITHEAAVGKISEKEIIYLMTRKLSRDEAVSMIIRGFMDVGIMGLPTNLN